MFDAFPTTTVVRPALQRGARRGRLSGAVKRGLDVAVSLALLLLVLPTLLVVAIAVRLDSPGPALFRQRRTGRDGRVFAIYKFRTMRVQQDGETVPHAAREDERVTRLGLWLRRSSLDELPQLFNVIAGDMSLVGPRPHAVAHDLHYGALIPDYGRRFAVRPGITGLAQIEGLRGPIQELGCMARRIEADVAYAEGWSVLGDLVILARTVPAVLSAKNAC